MLSAIKIFIKWIVDWFSKLSAEEKKEIIDVIVEKAAWLFSLFYQHCKRKREEEAQSKADSDKSSNKEGASQ